MKPGDILVYQESINDVIVHGGTLEYVCEVNDFYKFKAHFGTGIQEHFSHKDSFPVDTWTSTSGVTRKTEYIKTS